MSTSRGAVIASAVLLCLATGSAWVSPSTAHEQTPPAPTSPLIPIPRVVQSSPGDPFTLSGTTVIHVAGDDRLAGVGQYLSAFLGTAVSPEPLRVETGSADGKTGIISLQVGNFAGPGDEDYELIVTRERVDIRSRTPAGVFYGVQTLRQLMPSSLEHRALMFDKNRSVALPPLRISDGPRFAWRGAMLDVARHFLSVADVKRYIDLIALHKLNRLHLHLSDDQGWRIEIKSWPQLASHGASTQVGGGPGGYYTQQEYTDLVDYAWDRFVTVVPEIDMPGHTNAALASYAELNCTGQAPALYTGTEVGFSALCVETGVTYEFIDDVVREIAAITRGPYFHVGGDEVKTLSALQYDRFIRRVHGIVQSRGKQMIGWDEISPVELPPSAIVQHWRPKTPPVDAAARGSKVIMSPADRTYLDMKYDRSTPIGLSWAALISVERSYDWDPAAAGVTDAAVLGVEAPLWTETVANIRDAEFLAFPRLAAVAEVAWSEQADRRWDDFRARLAAQAPRWSALGINFYRAPEIPWK